MAAAVSAGRVQFVRWSVHRSMRLLAEEGIDEAAVKQSCEYQGLIGHHRHEDGKRISPWGVVSARRVKDLTFVLNAHSRIYQRAELPAILSID